jgi:uncharacterized protein
MELHGDPRTKRGPSAFLKKLLADGIDHEESIYADLKPVRVSYPKGDFAAGALETLRLMQAGTPLIAQGVLVHGDRVGIPDLIERRPGTSALGDFTYEPVEIKTARAVKPVYRLQLAFYAHLIADTIGTWPELAHVILVDGRRDTFALASVREHYESVLGGVVRVKEGEEPPVHISSTCGECPWEPACLTHAEETRDVSLTYGLQRRIAGLLREEGIATLAGLAAQDPTALAARAGIAPGHAATLVIQAQVLEDGQPRWRRAVTFEDAPTEIFFDIEGDPEHDVLYLFGVLLRTAEGEEYRAFVAENPCDERRAFEELLAFLEAHPGAPIYHYHDYERSALRRLVTRHGVDPARAPALLERMRDLNHDLVSTAVLPVYSYSLKAVAKRLGYRWSHPEASAAQSIFWYATWLKTGERALLDLAVEYNADDCRATRLLKDWLAQGPDAKLLPEDSEPAAKWSQRARSPIPAGDR